MKRNKKRASVSVIVPMFNAETTILETLNSIAKQNYPVREIIIVDNVSSDNSVALVKNYTKKTRIPILLLKQKENKGVGASFNRGVSKAKSSLIVLMHSDSSLSTDNELSRLVKPLLNNKNVVATYPTLLLPKHIWNTFNFWQKCLLVRSVDVESPSFTGKFDCVRRSSFKKVKGFNTVHFGHRVGIGGEDADLFMRLNKIGEMILSDAKAIHLHNLDDNYSFTDWIRNRKLLAKSYGRIARLHGKYLPFKRTGWGLSFPFGAVVLFIKPIIAILPFIPGLNGIGVFVLISYAFVNSQKMYLSTETNTNPRILLLPFIDIFLVYYESFWILKSFLIMQEEV